MVRAAPQAAVYMPRIVPTVKNGAALTLGQFPRHIDITVGRLVRDEVRSSAMMLAMDGEVPQNSVVSAVR